MPIMDTKRLKQTLARIEREQDRLRELAGQFRGVINYLDEELDSEPPPLTPGQEMDNMMEKVFAAHGRPMHPKIICEILVQKGINVQGENPVNNTRSHLSLDDRFEPVGNGLWGLKEWIEAESPPSNQNKNGERPDQDEDNLRSMVPTITDHMGKDFQAPRNQEQEIDDLPF